MSANNKVVLIGRVGNNPNEDMRTTQMGSQVVDVRLAVTRPGKDAQGNTQTDWVSCQFWNKNAENLAKFVAKGDLISVSGSIRVDNWEQDGQRRQKYFVHGESFHMLTPKSDKQHRTAPAHRAEPVTAGGSATQMLPRDDYLSEFALDDDELPPF